MISVEQIDIQTQTVVNVFESVKSAAKALNISSATISRVLHGGLKTSVKKKYTWKKVVKKEKEVKEKTRNFSIEQINIQTGKVIATFDSINDARNKLNYSYDGISGVIRCKTKSFNGYFWRRTGNNNEYIPHKPKQSRPIAVNQIDIVTGKQINAFTSITAAAKSVNCSTCSIFMCINEKNKTAKGYKWRKQDISSKV